MDQMGSQGKLELLDVQVLVVQVVHVVNKVKEDKQDFQVKQDLEVVLDQMGCQVKEVLLVHQVDEVHLVHQGNLEDLVKEDRKELQEHLDKEVQVANLEEMDNQELMASLVDLA